jgi:hypothetical protein
MTAPHVGPGAFKPYKPAIEIKEAHKPSYAFLSYNPPFQRDHSPDTFQRVTSFSELHRKGPIINDIPKDVALTVVPDSRNKHLQALVKEKMTRIYPKLAVEKFSSSVLEEFPVITRQEQDLFEETSLTRSPSLKSFRQNSLSSSASSSPFTAPPLQYSFSKANLMKQESKARHLASLAMSSEDDDDDDY